MTTFYFIRHGQTDANALGLKQGIINDERTHLTAKGRAQAQQLHDQFDISFADALYVSPLDRTRETAAILNTDAQLPEVTDPRLLEISYGSWDGRSNADLMTRYPDVFDPTLRDVLPSYTSIATDGESFEAVQRRVQDFMRSTSAEYPDGKIIVVTHGFTVKAAALVALQPRNPMSLPEPENTSVTKIELANDRYFVWYYNRFNSADY
ncbi:histidine phosphatase family protein [Lacticaseibacillus pabuli]|uniref:Histidine phosphatase family protein n=1 Tax=Lacticaseibacillus pabuli TaxID=3025672 RepID=A0ABY7WUF9_9LACO|nr:histidine phosphatase family protein [Lacticaseibacillus sp. KACC 23028]WDF82790.1 histidine phosphatase family protein [Lacticaseibacillus sp. KACC 23028]